MRRPALLAAVVGAVAVLLKRRGKSQQAERDLWTAAGDESKAAPDLR